MAFIPADQYARREQGRRAQRDGSAWELHVVSALTRRGVFIVHIPPPVQVIKRDGQTVTGRLNAGLAPDMLGSTTDGAALAIECKSITTLGTSWALPGRLREHQGRVLAQVDALGGVGALLLRERAFVAILPWPLCDPQPAGVSIPAEVIAAWTVPRKVAWETPLLSIESWRAYKAGGWEAVR